MPYGIPDSDTFRRVFVRVDPQELSKWLNNWLETERKAGRLVSVDGKTIRGSGSDGHKAYHVVSAWVGEQGITLGELQAGEKTNEITQVPELLDLLDIKGDIITADAMSCQKEIAAKIKEKEADYILALKGNQPTMEAGEDSSHARKDNSPLNMNILRKTALSLIKAVDLGKRISLQKKRYMAALNPHVLKLVISGF